MDTHKLRSITDAYVMAPMIPFMDDHELWSRTDALCLGTYDTLYG